MSHFEHSAAFESSPRAPNRREARLDAIRGFLMTLGSASIEDLTAMTGVSRMTVHRDLAKLEQRGVLRRTRGGASVEKSLLFEASVDYRLGLERRAKAALAAHAVTLIEPGQVVLLDDSTTSYTFLRALNPELPVTIASNFLPSINLAASRTNTHVIALGGDYQPSYQAFLGLLTERALSTIHADVLVASASAVQGQNLFQQSQLVISTRRAMVECSATRLLLVDSSKIGHTALYRSGSVEDYDQLIVDNRTDEQDLNSLSKLNVQVHVVRIDEPTLRSDNAVG